MNDFQNGKRLYMAYRSACNHFKLESTYDISKYNGVVSLKDETFAKNKFRWQFQALDVSNLSQDELLFKIFQVFKKNKFEYIAPKTFVSLMREKSPTIKDTLYYVEREIVGINEVDVNVLEGLYPKLYNQYEDGEISLETLLWFDKYKTKIVDKHKSKDYITWPAIVEWLENKATYVLPILERGIIK